METNLSYDKTCTLPDCHGHDQPGNIGNLCVMIVHSKKKITVRFFTITVIFFFFNRFSTFFSGFLFCLQKRTKLQIYRKKNINL